MKKYLIAIAIIIAGLIIAGAVYTLFHTSASTPDTINVAAMRPVGQDDTIIGNPTAPVILVEYCSPDSAYCTTFDGSLRSIIATYGPKGEVAVVFRQIVNTADTSVKDTNADDLIAMGAASVPFTVVLARNQKPITIDGVISYADLKTVVDHALSSTSDSR